MEVHHQSEHSTILQQHSMHQPSAPSAVSTASWNETKAVLQELEQLFRRDDDINDIIDIKKMQQELEIQSSNRLRDAREIVKALTAAVTSKQAEVAAPSQTEHEENMRKVSNKENLQREMQRISSEIDSKNHNISKISQEIVKLADRSKEYAISKEMADSRTAYAVSLYTKISNITWDYKAPSGKLAGCIGNDQKKELKRFELDTRAMTSYDTANALWDMIDAATSSDENKESRGSSSLAAQPHAQRQQGQTQPATSISAAHMPSMNAPTSAVSNISTASGEVSRTYSAVPIRQPTVRLDQQQQLDGQVQRYTLGSASRHVLSISSNRQHSSNASNRNEERSRVPVSDVPSSYPSTGTPAQQTKTTRDEPLPQRSQFTPYSAQPAATYSASSRATGNNHSSSGGIDNSDGPPPMASVTYTSGGASVVVPSARSALPLTRTPPSAGLR